MGKSLMKVKTAGKELANVNTDQPTQSVHDSPVIVLCGGGTGGHITPLLAIAAELKRLKPKCRIVYIGDKGGKFSHLTDNEPLIDERYFIPAGKFRRYHGEATWRRLLDVKTNSLNLRDATRTVRGLTQARRLIRKLHPDIVFLKGGAVGVPVGIAAGKAGLPLITHDSDTVPSLTNRIAGRWATLQTTGMPAEFYKSYNQKKPVFVGVPIRDTFSPVTPVQRTAFRQQFGIPAQAKVITITGGSQGAKRLNTLIKPGIIDLLRQFDDLYVLHQVGSGNTALYGPDDYNGRLKVLDFMDPLHLYTGAADIVICRGSATTLSEIGAQGRAAIVIPSPYLTGGHQLRNAEHLSESKAVLSLLESELEANPEILFDRVQKLFVHPEMTQELGANLATITKTDAAKRLAELILAQANTR